METIERDIVEKIEQTFSPDDATQAIRMLSAAGKRGRIARCVVFAAGGSLERLAQCVRLADEDYRDAIVAGEYDDMRRRLRDLRVSFLIDAPSKMWASEVAAALAPRGYVLSSIETVSAENRSANYTSDLFEGTATFEGDVGPIRLTKSRGQWTIDGDGAELEQCCLAKPLDNEQEFTDAVSAYIFAKRNRRKKAPGTCP